MSIHKFSRVSHQHRCCPRGFPTAGIQSEALECMQLVAAFGSSKLANWLRMQLAYDLAAALKNESKIKARRLYPQEIHTD